MNTVFFELFPNQGHIAISDEVIVYGKGFYGKGLIAVLKNMHIDISECFDNYIQKKNERVYSDICCVLPHYTENTILVSIKEREAILSVRRQLEELGCKHIMFVDHHILEREIYRLPDMAFLDLQFYRITGRFIDWVNPRTFNEKIQWLKIYDRKSEYIPLVDKYEVKKIVATKIGEEFVIPTLGIWESVDSIAFDKLPKEYVIKCTHDSGSTTIVNQFVNNEMVKEQLRNKLEEDYYILGREWPYKNVIHRIIAEPLLTNKNGTEIMDYKFMCFNGKVRCLFVCTDRFSGEELKVTFFDLAWNKLPFTRDYPSDLRDIEKPKSFTKMVELAEKLAVGIPFVRVDFYEVDGNPLFGEMTFYPGCGYELFSPSEWDTTMGDWLEIGDVKKIINEK